MKYQTYLNAVRRRTENAAQMLREYTAYLREQSKKETFSSIHALICGVESCMLDTHIEEVSRCARMLDVPEEFVVRSDARSAERVFAEFLKETKFR